MADERDRKRYYDLVYEAWMSGRDPDLIDRDQYAYCRASGMSPEEIGLHDVMPPERQEEPPYPEPEPPQEEEQE